MSIKNITESELVDTNIAYHRSLNPVAWKGIKMRSVVRQHLLIIAEMFVEFLNIQGLEVKDVVLTGSNANYNWTKYSDFDIHVVVDYSTIASPNVAMELFNAKKELWNSGHNIKVKGYDVELYVEDTATPPVSQGVYSLINGTWLRRPEYTRPAIDDAAIEAKVIDLMMQIDHIVELDSKDINDFGRLADKIKKMRKSGLDQGGEYSIENLSFKILRNEGYISKLHAHKQRAMDNLLTIEGA